MAKVELGRALIALHANPTATQVAIPRLSSLSSSSRTEKTFVRFAGDPWPTAFHGEGRDWTFTLSCMYDREEQGELVRLLSLLEDVAPAAPDSRLLLRTHAGLAPGMNKAAVVEVDGDISQAWAFEAITVSFTARMVQFALEDG